MEGKPPYKIYGHNLGEYVKCKTETGNKLVIAEFQEIQEAINWVRSDIQKSMNCERGDEVLSGSELWYNKVSRNLYEIQDKNGESMAEFNVEKDPDTKSGLNITDVNYL